MPGNLIGATPNGVMPASLCTAFTEFREYVQLQNQYHDGTIQRSQLAQTSRRTFRLSKRLSSSLLSALYSFWGSQNGGLTPFVFYNPFDVASGQQIGSNYDPTGSSTQGRVTVVFRGNWAQATDIARTNVQQIELVELDALYSTVTTVLSTVTGKVYHYSGTTSDPAGWASSGFNDSAWSTPVVQTNYTPAGVPSGATLITDLNSARTGQPATDLFRIPFSLPTGTIIGAQISWGADDQLQQVWINGVQLTLTSAQSGSSVNLGALSISSLGTTNVLGLKLVDTTPFYTSIGFQLVVTTQ